MELSKFYIYDFWRSRFKDQAVRRRHRGRISREKKCWDFQVSQDLLQHNSDLIKIRCKERTSWKKQARVIFLLGYEKGNIRRVIEEERK